MLRAVLLLSFALLTAACTQRRTATGHKGRIITLTDTTFDTGGSDTVRFGRLRSGEIAVVHFYLSNAATRPAVIRSYARSCGCTTLEYDPEPITPGRAQRMRLMFDSRGEHGWQLKTVDLFLAGAARPFRLFIEAEVE